MLERRGLASCLFDILNHVFLLLLAISCILPLVHLFALSLSDRAAATGGLVTFWPIRFTPISYQKVIEAGAFLSALQISIIRTSFGTALQMTLVVLTGFALSKTKDEFPGRNIFMGIILIAYLFNGGLIPWFLAIRNPVSNFGKFTLSRGPYDPAWLLKKQWWRLGILYGWKNYDDRLPGNRRPFVFRPMIVKRAQHGV